MKNNAPEFNNQCYETTGQIQSGISLQGTGNIPKTKFTKAEITNWLIGRIANTLEIEAEAIDPTVSFEYYGLDSSEAVVLSGDLQDWLGCTLDPEILLDYSTIRDLVEYLHENVLSSPADSIASQPSPVAIPILRESHSLVERRLSRGQKALWFLYKLASESAAYHVAFSARIPSEVDTVALHRSFQALADRHPLLRATFSEKDGEPRQTILEEHAIGWEIHDASRWDERELRQNVIRDYERPFDLERGSAIRVSLFRRHAGDHVMLITLHHIVCDGWSVWMLLDELRSLHAAFEEGRPLTLPPLDYTYFDYLSWQEELLASPQGDTLWQYWSQRLAGELPILDLPTDRPRSSALTFQGAIHSFSLDETLTRQLKQLASAEGVTLYMLLLAGFQVLLHRYTRQEDILVGSPMKCRNQPEFQKIFGYFVNPVVIRGNLAENPQFTNFLRQIRQRVLEAISHQDYPFPLLVERLQPERHSLHSPLFQTLFVLQNPQKSREILDLFSETTTNRVQWGGLTLEAFDIPQQQGQFDLALEMLATEQGIIANWKYNARLFEPETIARLEGHFRTLLAGIVANPQQSVGSLPLLTEPERHQLIWEWNATTIDYAPEKCWHELFAEQVERNPEAIAVGFEDRFLTYRELDQKANQLAHYLREFGVGAEVLVGLCVERSLEMVIALLGIFKASGAYVPLDPAYPKERLEYMLTDARIPLLITLSHLVSRLPLSRTTVICLDQNWTEIARHPTTPLDRLARLDNLAYIIYTSGSTGKPKGVQIQHRGLYNLAKAQIQWLEVKPASKTLQFASLSFDASISEIVMTLGAGASLYLAKTEALLPGSPLARLLNHYKITHITLPPSALSVMTPDDLPSLETLIVAGEACPEEIVGRWSSRYRFFNAYGPTESTVCATIARCIPTSGKVSIGRPISNIQTYILDPYLQPVPIGVSGELWIGGIGLARGYLNRPDLTDEKFIPNPFAGGTSARLYKTGDLARYLPDGNIEFLGRIDHQIKLRGFRIEIGEIETVLLKHEDVREAIIIHRQGTSGNQSLIAFVVARSQTLTASLLRDFLKTQLPDYMIPSALIFLEDLPLTPNGKIDRRALATIDISEYLQGAEQDQLLPLDPTETLLAELWRDVLEVKRVGREDNFFELGGHSLLAITLISRINAAFSIDVPIRCLFEAPTIAELAKTIAILSRSTAGNRLRDTDTARESSGQTPYVNIPETVSLPAREFLQRLTDPALLPAFPDKDDLAGWKTLQAFAEADGKAKAALLLKHYEYTVQERDLGGVPILDIQPQNWTDNSKVLVYTHGGSHVMYSAASTLDKAVITAHETGLRVISVDYTLAPFAQYQQMSDEVITAIGALMQEGQCLEDMAIYGDSSGGGLAAAVVLKMRDRGLGMPGAVVLISPWVDVTPSGDTETTLKASDPNALYEKHGKYAAAAYAASEDQKDPYVSPVYGDYSRGFPPTLIQGGLKEVLLSGFVRLYQALDTAGQTVKLDLYEGMIHNFPYRITDAPEAILARQKMREFLHHYLVLG